MSDSAQWTDSADLGARVQADVLKALRRRFPNEEGDLALAHQELAEQLTQALRSHYTTSRDFDFALAKRFARAV